ncbi:MAG: ABC transporter ATPase [Bacteroidetes bacterium]|nr:ABC transporter ATPase [Bacteroidota bacterium]
MTNYKNMPEDARVWVYQSNRFISDLEVAAIEKAGIQFIADWTAHGASLKASFDILYNYFIVISVDEQQANASGCSIDKGIYFVKELEKQFDLILLDRMQVAFRNGNEIKTCHLNNLLEELTRSGLYSENGNKEDVNEVIVFNNMVTTKKQFDTEWEINLKQSWQSRVLPV